MLKNLLKQIGLSDKEIEVYLSSLKLGPQPASIIAKSAGLNRSTTYVILESLYHKGLISQFIKAEVKYFSVVSPENLVNYVERTINEMKSTRDQLIDFIPEFLSITNKVEIKPRLMFYEGQLFVKEILDEMSAVSSDLYSIISYNTLSSNRDNYYGAMFSSNYYFNHLSKKQDWHLYMNILKSQSRNGLLLIRKYFASNHIKPILCVNIDFPKDLDIHSYLSKVILVEYSMKDVSAYILDDELFAKGLRSMLKLIKNS